MILAYYGVVMLLALPFLALPGRWLLGLAVAWAVLEPVLSQVVRPLLPERQFDNPALEQLAEPGRLLAELAFTGYYPAVGWLAYALLGMGLGRLGPAAHDGRRAAGGGRFWRRAVGATVLSGVPDRPRRGSRARSSTASRAGCSARPPPTTGGAGCWSSPRTARRRSTSSRREGRSSP